MRQLKYLKLLLVCYLAFFMCSCEKFLDAKTDKKLVVPRSLEDLQSLIDNFGQINGWSPGEGELSSDDYFLLHDTWVARSQEEQRAYIWEPDFSTTLDNWRSSYRIVYYVNLVLENLESVERTQFNQYNWDNLKGQAHFLRAKCFLDIASIWALAYDESTASTDLGIPLRLNSDFNVMSVRASLKETYQQIISDLEISIDLLPEQVAHVGRASKPAALGLLARTYLFMRNYKQSLNYANLCLDLVHGLIDYNELDSLSTYPIPSFNKETIFFSMVQLVVNPAINVNNALVDTTLYQSYKPNDLRKILFFKSNGDGNHRIHGNYTGSSSRFSGLAVDEILLIRAESRIRVGDIQGGMDDLNHLLIHRFTNSIPFEPLFADSYEEALQYILDERRKQLLMRGLRFPDVKRLNKEGRNIGFRRVLEGEEFSLPPNDLRFALPIPEAVLELAPGIVQNLR